MVDADGQEWDFFYKRQKGSFLPIASLLGSVADPLIDKIVKPILKKNFLVEGLKEDAADYMPRQKNRIQRVKPTNGQLFLARYERVSRQNLTRNVTVRRTRQIRPRKKCKTKKVGNLLRKIANTDLYRFT